MIIKNQFDLSAWSSFILGTHLPKFQAGGS